MWLMKAPAEYPKDGEIYGHTLVNGYCLVALQWYWNLLMYLGFEDKTPEGWPKAKRKKDVMERVIFTHYGGIGDVLFTTVAYEAYRRKYKDIYIEVATSIRGGDLLLGNPNISRINYVDDPKNVYAKIDQYDDAVTFDCMLAGYGLSTVMNIYDIILDWTGMEIEDSAKKPHIYLAPNDRASVRKKLFDETGIDKDKYITMQPESSTNNRNIKLDTAFELAEKFIEDGYKVLFFGHIFPGKFLRKKQCSCGKFKYVQFSDTINSIKIKCDCGEDILYNHDDPVMPNIHILAGWHMNEIAHIIDDSSGFIGIDSCGVHIAAAMGKITLGLFSSFDGDLRMRYYPNASWIQKPYRCAPCFNHHVDCRWRKEMGLKVPPCMDQFTAQEIYDAYKNLEAEVLASKPITKPDRFILCPTPVDCPICGSKERQFITRKGNFCYYDCLKCGTSYIDNPPKGIEAYSDKGYWKVYHWDAYLESERGIARTLTEALGKRFKFSGSVFEIGPGTGMCLSELKRLGWKTKAIEASTMFTELSKEVGADSVIPDVTIGNFIEYETEEKFDMVSFQHSLEHMPNMRAALEKAIGMLNPGGVLNIIVPTSDSWKKYLNTWSHINAYFPGEHTILVPQKVLLDLLDSLNMNYQVLGPSDLRNSEIAVWVLAQKKE
jgi:ADP-heptose:LPS heptosyltransferase/SAM-dependent methyltransferase